MHESVSNSEACLHEHFWCCKFSKKVINPFESEYDPLIDLSAELGPIFLNYYHTHISVLRWMVELGRIFIMTEVSMLASQISLPREVHLEAVFHILGYGWYLIRPIQLLTCQFFGNMIGVIFMVHLSQGSRKLI